MAEEKNTNSSNDAQEVTLHVNKFYRDSYRRLMSILLFLVVIGVALSLILMWMSFDRAQPKYYASVISGQVTQLHALSEPVVSNPFILQWSALTARALYTIDFANYSTELNQVKYRFSDEGWIKMMNALQSSGFLSELVSSRLVVTSVVVGPPVILARMIVHGRYTWLVQMQLLVTYVSASVPSTPRTLTVTMRIQRVPTLDAPQGIQVVDFTT
ncbi:MAG: hypothetical protein A3I77_05870 [Gammaproteobacteria bacterium RIFCSPLOWO2_02_FULL_42_14]|nr:MAG: hypothetical protein A3B71_02140 [Gammaproteobacteria bacterium RIFCSPHIGHO2_02_FULL_42_43]OGT27645.1 MAG: hypothetical protein A2624_00285 [Gammaproteobacteria bacterium RIFCSPHIGHO2_01_FULL_42_8]OGT53397.1 MAG: hypothetical protein A3E54_06635 [Gammaproteobacteria bacterium RIFCSPHIGHO2_12_FULL_41_25]OGT63427.1 MAG: hypothetical protein A3I77_05870 [Gammaproteobacteria bacterium RIFCSPLOWO2_02_FULL_42_14]OGT87353.1 MAG: hypothetical protein A3G86_00315 [Gammaproteobacteria bacterium R